MSKYIEQTLTTGETVLVETRIALQKYWLNFALAGLFLFTGAMSIVAIGGQPGGATFSSVYLFLAALLLAPPVIRYFTNELALTNKRVIAKRGLLSLQTIEMRLEKIESIRVEQSIFGRLLGYGTVVIVGTGGTREPIPNIPDPVTFRVNFGVALEKLKSPAL
jgi:uncharacterized membrane protein YdbT with pleckstrin-like domain